ncbi:MAG: KOW domain-containing RNA-binding protein [Candidatus Cohnella colombiensis]|uniref:KOW domain-containing RNA-binding protein n=1 Tax=Candidatus Cohnella colombiensis TaxID=3121368 RepID=A0AA95EXI1_9BACL|nr:MAG: KOW domain-containing RNA-binding protein [Cohnella sp.]
MTINVKLEPGDIVKSLRGRDEDGLLVVIAILDERFALVADGDKRRFDRPKRKNVLHLEPIGIQSEEVANSIRDTGRVTNAKLRFAIGQIEQRLVKEDRNKPGISHSVARDAHAEEKGE